MTASIATQLQRLRNADLGKWTVSMWLVKRRLEAKVAQYGVLRVDLDQALQAKMKQALAQCAQARDYALEEYGFLTADQDDRLLTLDAAATDFSRIQAEVDQGLANKKVERYEDLLDSWAFVVKLEHDSQAVYGVRKISRLTQVAKVASVSYLLFRDKQLVDLEDKQVFTLDTRIDFFAFGGTLFIVNKRDFESAMNFRAGMEQNRDAVLEEFSSLKVLSDIEPIRKAVGANLHLLRKISEIQKNGYYKDKKFLEHLIERNRLEQWVKVEAGRIVVDEKNVDAVLTLLNNSRLRSPINNELFDAVVKKKVG